jgi:hypothetical protein
VEESVRAELERLVLGHGVENALAGPLQVELVPLANLLLVVLADSPQVLDVVRVVVVDQFDLMRVPALDLELLLLVVGVVVDDSLARVAAAHLVGRAGGYELGALLIELIDRLGEGLLSWGREAAPRPTRHRRHGAVAACQRLPYRREGVPQPAIASALVCLMDYDRRAQRRTVPAETPTSLAIRSTRKPCSRMVLIRLIVAPLMFAPPNLRFSGNGSATSVQRPDNCSPIASIAA